jgi:uncharacterized damage-inducible protein DinB
MGLNESILAELKQEAKVTRRLLERTPQEVLTWRPHEKSMTLGRLAGHIAELPTLLTAILTQDELDFATANFKPAVPNSTSELLEIFDKNISTASDLLQSQSDERLFGSWKLRHGEKILFEMPRMSVIRSMVLNHIVHHRGQFSVYLRLKDVPLPSIYGPTADEQM